MHRFAFLFALLAAPVYTQEPPDPLSIPSVEPASKDVRLPNGKSQREEILKADYRNNLKDAAELADLATSLRLDLEKDNQHVLSLSSLKKVEEIEKLAHRIRGRMRRY